MSNVGFLGNEVRFSDNPALRKPLSMVLCLLVTLVGPRAMIGYKPRQARKGATVVADSCAEVWLARAASIRFSSKAGLAVRTILILQYFDEDTQ